MHAAPEFANIVALLGFFLVVVGIAHVTARAGGYKE